MSRIEQANPSHQDSERLDLFARRSEGVPDDAPLPAADGDAGLRILLFDSDIDAAETAGATLHEIFGDRCHWECVGDISRTVELMRRGEHDVYLFAEDTSAGDAVDFVRSRVGEGCHMPIIVLTKEGDSNLDLKLLDAGAADCIPKTELTRGILERSIRHALLRQHVIARTRNENVALAREITQLNTLREAKHRFVDNACHDFRSPLTVIKEFSSIIAEGLAGDVNEEQAEFLEIILTRIDQLSHMVDAILDASRLESDLIGVQREEHALEALIAQAEPTLKQQAKSQGAEIQFSIDEGLPTVFADPDNVGRIIVNLVTNACKFAGEGGVVQVWARYEPDASAVMIGVTDNGPGIAPEHVKLIFDRFQQVESNSEVGKKGFGLGLHIASELVRVNFGKLSVESEPQKGSTFAFTLPVFDIDTLIPRHLRFLKTSRHGFQNISIAMVTAGGTDEPEALSELERFLNRQLRPYDLLLRLSDGGWLMCIACEESDLTNVTGRIQRSHAEHNCNRPGGALPDIGFRPIGTWLLSNRPGGLTDAIRSAYALDLEGGAQRQGTH
jgi:signal transduction histidine kinase